MRRDEGIRALEAVRVVAGELGIEPRILKPCIAWNLAGNLADAERHEAAFVLALEVRSWGYDEKESAALLRPWATDAGLSTRRLETSIRGAFRKNPTGGYKYHPPGLNKKEHTRAARWLTL